MLLTVDNVNDALDQLKIMLTQPKLWRNISPRGMTTLEYIHGPVITCYEQPSQRVLFSAARDANPFFHFFESLWILDGRYDVAFLAQFNKRMVDYSDDGTTFHAPYGYRLRHHFGQDQIKHAINALREDPASRQVVLSIWDTRDDLGAKTRDLPCNDMIFLKVRDGALNMTVCCRSNDAIWGAYGANAVQFSVLQEFIARAIGVRVGLYHQVSDSFHVYVDNDAARRVMKETRLFDDPYKSANIRPFPLMIDGMNKWEEWLAQLRLFLNGGLHKYDGRVFIDPFFTKVADPMMAAWRAWRANGSDDKPLPLKHRYDAAMGTLYSCQAQDWRRAAVEWIGRRAQEQEGEKP